MVFHIPEKETQTFRLVQGKSSLTSLKKRERDHHLLSLQKGAIPPQSAANNKVPLRGKEKKNDRTPTLKRREKEKKKMLGHLCEKKEKKCSLRI